MTGLADGKGPDGPKSAIVPPSLMSAAQANPDQTFNVIVEGSKGQSSGGVASDVTTGNGKLKRKFLSLSGVSASISGKDLVKLAKNPHVSAIVPDVQMKTSDYQSAEMWRQSTGVSSLWSKPAVTCAKNSRTGLKLDPTCVPAPAVLAPQAPTIAILDSGIDASKAADFGSRIVARANFVASEPGAQGDPDGHGTMVAGAAAGGATDHSGAAPNAPLVDVRVADSHGQAMTSDILAGIDWVLATKAQYGIKVANLSLAGTTETSFQFDPLDLAVEKLWLNGIVVVVAAGNYGQPDGPVKLSGPGNDPFVITVGATDVRQTADPSDDTRAPWSAYGYTADGFLKPEISAPGRFMVLPSPAGSFIQTTHPDRVTAPGYMWMSGTSFSSPIVAGAAAQLLARHPDWSPDQVKGALMSTATRLAGGLTGLGVGEVNAAAAAAVASPPNPNQHLNDFVTVDPTTGLNTFVASNWASAVSTSSNWTESNWTESNWTESNWTESNWTESNWTESNWTESNWTESNWTE